MKTYLLFFLTVLSLPAMEIPPTNDATAIQAVLDYAGSANPSNVVVQLGPGEYHLNRTLSLPTVGGPQNPVLFWHAGIKIRGAGMSQTKLIFDVTNSIGLALTGSAGYEGVTIEDLCLIGPGLARHDLQDQSIGLAIGSPQSLCFCGRQNAIRNCAIIGWAYGSCVTNQWGLVFENCIVSSNTIEGLRFVGTHGSSVQNCRVTGGWSTACGIGIGYHPPPNNCYGDNAQIVNSIILNCTNGVWNSELNLTCLNVHLESCGSYYSLYTWASFNTLIGGYTLDNNFWYPWTNGFAAQIQCDSTAARQLIIENVDITGAEVPRYAFAVRPDGSPMAVPTMIGNGKLLGLYGASKTTVYPLGTTHWPWQSPANAVRMVPANALRKP